MTNLARRDDNLPRSTPAYLPSYAKDKEREYVGDPWSKQPHESHKAYAAFCTFRDMDPDTRTVARVKELHSSTVLQWSPKHRWMERVEAYDNFRDAKVIAANKRQAIRASQKHAQQAADVQEILMRPVDEYRRRMEANGGADVVGLLSDEQVLKLATAFARDLPAMQEAERKALASTGESRADPVKIKVMGEKVRTMLNSPALGQLMERAVIEVSGELPADDGSS